MVQQVAAPQGGHSIMPELTFPLAITDRSAHALAIFPKLALVGVAEVTAVHGAVGNHYRAGALVSRRSKVHGVESVDHVILSN